MTWDALLSWIGVAAAIGTAAMGLVEALKAVTIPGIGSLATVGLNKVKRFLGPQAIKALESVYGPDAGTVLLEGAWRRGSGDLAQTLRNGLRMAVFSELSTLGDFISSFGQKADDVSAAVTRLKLGDDKDAALSDPVAAREKIARLEAAIDARVDAAVAAGRDSYVASMQVFASLVAVGGSLLMSVSSMIPEETRPKLHEALLVGLVAVPMAPVAKDLVSFLNSLRSSFEKRPGKA